MNILIQELLSFLSDPILINTLLFSEGKLRVMSIRSFPDFNLAEIRNLKRSTIFEIHINPIIIFSSSKIMSC